jgi:sugar lactone lactonase YvrE
MKSTFVSSLPCAMNSSGYIVTLLVVVAASSTWSASPVWTSVPVSNAVAGTPYLYHLQASDADQDALSFGAASAPPWAAVTPEPGGPVGSETITLLAGRSPSGYSGDGGPATNAQFQRPYSVAYDAAGNCYVSDAGTHRIRKIDTNGTITAFAGNGGTAYNGDGMAATNAAIWVPLGIACDTNGNVFIVSHEGNRIRKVATNGIITTIVGDGSQSSGGDGGPATSAKVNRPTDLAFDGAGKSLCGGTIRASCAQDHPGGVITRVAGTGTVGTNGAGGPATSAQLNNPYGIIAAPDGTLFISDYASHRIVKVDDKRRADRNCRPQRGRLHGRWRTGRPGVAERAG